MAIRLIPRFRWIVVAWGRLELPHSDCRASGGRQSGLPYGSPSNPEMLVKNGGVGET